MNLKHKIMFILASLAASKHAVSASILTGAAVAVAAPSLGFDPVTWAVAGAGAAGAYFKIEEKSRRSAIGNGIMSVFLGGLGGPYVPSLVLYFDYPKPTMYLSAFLLALVFPFLADFAVKKWLNK